MKLCCKEVENAKVNDKILFVSFSIGTQWIKHINPKRMWWMFLLLLFFYIFIRTPVLWVVRCMYCTLPLAAKHRHIILHCICLVKLIEHMLIWVQLKWSSAYQIQCPIHLVSIGVLTLVRIKALNKRKKSQFPVLLCTTSMSFLKTT